MKITPASQRSTHRDDLRVSLSTAVAPRPEPSSPEPASPEPASPQPSDRLSQPVGAGWPPAAAVNAAASIAPTPAAAPARNRTFLFLQGPPGAFFRHLGREIEAHGARVLRINFNGGDQRDWAAPATCYRRSARHWTIFIERFLRDNGVTDLVLFGDCRPLHMAAHQMARLRGIRVHVFEEGYIRPNWLTLERDGVNGHSSLPRDPHTLLAEAKGLELPPPMPAIVATLDRRIRDTTRYFSHSFIGKMTLRYPFYTSHRPGSIMGEGIGWAAKLAYRTAATRRAAMALRQIEAQRYYLFPLQLSSDYQIRAHSPFSSMRQAVDHVLESFAAHAPAPCKLLIKAHPLDAKLGGWGGYLARRARRLGLLDRLVHIDGGDLQTLAENSLGLVVVNSTSATFALDRGVPVMALGRAVYAMPGITHQGLLDEFWTAPQAPEPAVYDAFRRVLHARCLVRGGLASESATRILVRNAADRLLAGK